MTQKLNLELNYKNQKMREEMQRKSELKQGKMRYESYLARQRVYLWVGSLTILGFLVVALIVLRRSRKLKSLYQRLDERTKDLRDSINYAKRIQDTILPSERLLNEAFREHFVYYKPKDVVAGDFYWIKLKEDCVYFAVADCTGHGVPGALVSLICHEALEKSVFTLHDKNLNEILDSVRDLVVKKLNAKGYQKVKDGMDIALCKIGPDKKKLEFVGAHNPLWVSRNKEIIQIKGDRQPVGLYDNSSPFKNHQFKIEKDDVIYLSSDGYVDQFGGDSGKKFKSSRLKKQLLGISNNKLKDQKLELANQFVKWKADFEQLDDVCIMGVKV
jgi:serine phosphatase RsbU (regulator of sigma subunit)